MHYFKIFDDPESIICTCVAILPVVERHGQAIAGRPLSASLKVEINLKVCPIRKRKMGYQSYSSK